MRNELEQRFQRHANSLTTLREEVRKEIVRWEFSPVEFLSYELEMPRTGAVFYAGGYNGADHLLLVKHFSADLMALTADAEDTCRTAETLPVDSLIVEEFVFHRGDILDISRFFRGQLKEIYHIQLNNGRRVERAFLTDRMFGHGRWLYEGNRRVRFQGLDDSGNVTSEIAYGPHGEQTIYRVRRDGTKFQMGQALPKGVTAKSLKETIQTRLRMLIPEIVAKANINEPIYCVVLAFDGENDVLPPMIGFGLEPERQRWMEEHQGKAKEWIWNPAEFYHFEKPHTQFDDDALEESCSLLNDYLADRDSVLPAIKLLIEIARELNDITWPPTVKRTNDFVVYAVDLELASLRKNLKACIGDKQFTALKEKKLI